MKFYRNIAQYILITRIKKYLKKNLKKMLMSAFLG